MFGLHMPELIIILVVAFLIFGPKRLPEAGSAIARTIKSFNKSMHEEDEQPEEQSSPDEKQEKSETH